MDKLAFGNFLAELRNEKGLTQEQLAELINVNYKTVSKWECGNSLPSLDTMVELTKIFEVSLYEFSIYKRIQNPLISKKDINRIVNKNTLKKHIVLKAILLLISISLLLFITYSCIYTINNHNQMEIYELASEDNDYHIEGLFAKNRDFYYLSVSYVNFLDLTDTSINDKTKLLQYSVNINNTIEEHTKRTFENHIKIKDALSSIKIYVSNRKLPTYINHFYLTINYENEKGVNVTKTFKIILSNKQSNDKIFY